MAHYTKVIKEILQPNDKFTSVIDTFDDLGRMVETYQKVRDKKIVTEEDLQFIMFFGMFTINFYPYWQANGAVIRPILINALQQKERPCIEVFMEEALPAALTLLMPTKQLEYDDLRMLVRKRFQE